MDKKELEELATDRRAQILAAPRRELSRVAGEIEALALRLHELDAEAETLVWAAHPDRYDAARPVLRLLGKDAAKVLEDAAALLRDIADSSSSDGGT